MMFFFFFNNPKMEEPEMDAAKQRIIDLFRQNVKGKIPDVSGRDIGHDGRFGHWLEEQFGIRHNADNDADLFGFELKNETHSRTTFGDWSANEYVFNAGAFRHIFSSQYPIVRRDKFMRIFGHPSPQHGGRYSWSGRPCPKIMGFNDFGEVLRIDESHNNDILAVYDFAHDLRPDKSSIVPAEFQRGEIVLARWYGETSPVYGSKCLKAKVEDKFNQSGWFTCKTDSSGRYAEICFGAPMNYSSFLSLVRTGEAFFDSGMHEGNDRPYSQWRMNNSGWDRLITERYT